jgi:hypothetical protein
LWASRLLKNRFIARPQSGFLHFGPSESVAGGRRRSPQTGDLDH